MKIMTAGLTGRAAKGVLAALLVTSVAAPTLVRATSGRHEGDSQDRRDGERRDGDRDRDEERDTATPIRHLVVIFQENVSFDHYFATYPHATNADGSHFTAAPGTPIANGLFPGGLLDHNPNSTQPFRLAHSQAVTCDQDHNYADEQKSFHFGLMDKFPDFVGVTGPCDPVPGTGKGLVMGYYDGNTVTALWNYAQHFAMSDNSFSTTFGPSTPGALNLIAGQTWGAMITAGSAAGNVTAINGAGIGSVIGDPRPDPTLDDCTLPGPRTYIAMSGRNIGDLLNEHNLTWGWFQGGFKPAPVGPGAPSAAIPGICGSFHAGLAPASFDYIPHHAPFQYFPQTANPHHLPPSSASKIGRTDQASHQYDLSDFFTALDSGRLPAVSYLKAAAYQDGHAGYSDPLDEQTFVVDTINRLMESPEWESTAVIVLYDDSDGWYDHVMGPVVHQSNTPDDNLFGPGNCGTAPAGTFNGRCGVGPRQPLLVISSWARQNFVDHTLTDQSSVLRFVEDNWHLGRLGNQSSDAAAGSLLGLFDFAEGHPRAPKLLLNPVTGTP
jgi:phospholipase C